MYDWLVFGHVVGAILWVGGAILGSVLILRARRSELGEKLALLRLMDKVEPIFPIGAALVLGFGIWMVIDREAIGFGDPWLLIAYGAILASGLVQAVVTPRLRRMRRLLESEDPAAHPEWGRLSLVVPIDAALLIVAVWAMTTKPGI